jgi:5-methylcytosine-specific restriction endonuclease McrA
MPTTISQAPTYSELLQMEQWQEKRKSILLRDDNKCRNCGTRNQLQVHHRQYHINSKTGAKLNPWQYHSRYLITLCKSCHEIGHKHFNIQTFYI